MQTQDDYVFVPDRFTVDPGPVRLTVMNVAEQMTHNLEVTEGAGPEEISAGISLLAPGEERTALQSLVRALWISPLHVGAALVRRPGMFGWVAPALVRLRSFQSVYSMIASYFNDDGLRQVILLLKIAGGLKKTHGPDFLPKGGRWLFFKGAEVVCPYGFPDVHGVEEGAVKVENSTGQFHAFTGFFDVRFADTQGGFSVPEVL